MEGSSVKIAFCGSPDFAVPHLEACLKIAVVDLVITQPDRPAGRGRKLQEPPTKAAARAHGLPVMQPTQLRGESLVKRLQGVDIAVVVAYGRLIPPALLGAPRLGFVNVHASLLPRWRGASPIAAAIAAGDAITGVSLMQLEAGLDTGPVFAARSTAIVPHDTTGSLTRRLARLGAELLGDMLPRVVRGEQRAQAQPQEGVTLAPRLTRADGAIDWSSPAKVIEQRVRAFSPWPGSHTVFGGQRVKLTECTLVDDTSAGDDGTVGCFALRDDKRLVVRCGQGSIAFRSVQSAGARAMPAATWFQGNASRRPPSEHHFG